METVYVHMVWPNLGSRTAKNKNRELVLVLVLVVDERGSFSAIDAHIFPCLVQTVLEDALTDDESMTCCGNRFHSSIILFEKNVFRAVVLHLGLKSFCECPLNPYVSKAG